MPPNAHSNTWNLIYIKYELCFTAAAFTYFYNHVTVLLCFETGNIYWTYKFDKRKHKLPKYFLTVHIQCNRLNMAEVPGIKHILLDL